jgi:hypothetical protein
MIPSPGVRNSLISHRARALRRTRFVTPSCTHAPVRMSSLVRVSIPDSLQCRRVNGVSSVVKESVVQ